MQIHATRPSPSRPSGILKDNYRELELIVEGLKARELSAKDAAELAEVKSQLATWEAIFRAAGGNPDRVRPASFRNDLRVALAGAFPILHPDRYTTAEDGIAQVKEYQVAASDMGGPDRDALVRREAALTAGLAAMKRADRTHALGMGLAQMSWMAA
ncbi:MAG: hypothetical protein AB1758_30715, partial [Candidatus Eremiobacterota bacterium]